MAQNEKIGKHATKITSGGSFTCITYHGTDVVKFNPNEIILNTGGWFTASTKSRMNQTSNEYGLNFTVQQKNGKWYVYFKGESILFDTNTITLAR